MGLRPHLRQLRRTHGRARSLPRPIQLQTTTRQPRPQTAGLETEQPRWELQLTEELALLSDHARRVLEGAAVAGDPFEPELAAAAAAGSETAAVDALDE